MEVKQMKKYRVVFHFNGDDTKTLSIEADDRENVLHQIYAQKYFDAQDIKGNLFRINTDLVTYVAVYDN